MINGEHSADLVLRGGTVHILDEADCRTHALAVRDGVIVAHGADAEALADDAADVIDLGGRCVLPGINDAHLHASWLGALWPQTVFGSAPEAPRALVHDHADRRAALLRAGRLLASLGITSYTEPGIGPGEDDGPTGSFGSDVLAAYRELDAEGLLRQRVNLLLLFGLVDGPGRTVDILAGIRHADTAVRDERSFRIAGVKVFGDGIPPMRSAYIDGAYADGSHGALLIDGDTDADAEHNLHRVVAAAHRAGLQVAVHATGDRLIRVFVDAVRAAQAEHPADLRHYIVHGDLLPTSRIVDLVDLGMGVTMQAGIAQLTRGWMQGALDDARVRAAWPARELMDAGAALTLTSDAPVITPDWRDGIAAADALLGPASDRRARLHALLRRYTAIPAWQDHAETWKGTLQIGMAADMVVLDGDVDTVAAADMPQIGITQTYLAGRCVFDAASAPDEAAAVAQPAR